MKKITLISWLAFSTIAISAQTTVPGTFSSSWIGNTFHSAGKDQWPTPTDVNDDWVQNYIDCMTVTDDGTCYTTSNWDEGGRKQGIYKNGDVLGNGGSVGNCGSAGGYSISGTNIIGNGKTITNAGKPKALAMGKGPLAGKLLVADIGSRMQILVYDVSGTGTPVIVETIGATGGIVSDFTINYDLPTAINSAIAYPAGTYAPGVYHPLKLWGMTGVGCDAQGRVFVSTSEMGSGIRCFKKVDSNWILDWKVESYFFCDNVFYDEASDAIDIYGIQEHIKMNFSATTAGQEWSIYGYSLDRNGYPEDPRGVESIHDGGEHALKGAIMREINGTRYIWTSGMTCQPPNIFKYKAGTEIAVPCGMFMQRNHRIYDLPITYWWPPQRPSTDKGNTIYWEDFNNNGKYEANEYTDQTHDFGGGDFMVDKNGNIWQGQNPITVWNATIKPNGNISYSSKNTTTYTITGIPGIGKIVYQEDKDRLVLETAACRDIDGGKVYVVNNWSQGNRAATFVSNLKIPNIRPNDSDISSWTAAGDYGFEVGWSTRAKVWVTDLRTGELIGTMEPSLASGGVKHTGWVDIAGGIQAFKRSNGEFLIFVEENGIGAVTLYRWRPVACTVSVSNISVTPYTAAIEGIGTVQLTSDVTPTDACNKIVIWTSSNTAYATVSPKGLVTSLAPGTTTITATTEDGFKTSTCEVTVSKVDVGGVGINPLSGIIGVGETLQLNAVVSPSNASNPKVTWSTSDASKATVSESGEVKGVALGDVVITATTADGSFTSTCAIKVDVVHVSGVSFTESSIYIAVAESRQLNAVVSPANASDKSLTWSSGDDLIAFVSNTGMVKGVAAGTVKITATTVDGNIKADATVNVMAHEDAFDYFDYTAGDIAGKGTNTDGWGGPWVKSSGTIEVVDGNLGNDNVGKMLKTISITGGPNYTRMMASKWADNGKDIWVSFFMKREASTPLNWGGLSLFNTGSEDLFIGCPNGAGFVGFDSQPSTVPNTQLNYVLVKCKMNGTAATDSAYMWVNYFGESEPSPPTAQLKRKWGTTGFDKIRIANSPDYSISYDRLRIANTFAAGNLITGISYIRSGQITAYPNPVTNHLQLSVTADKIVVYSIDGKPVMETKGNNVNMENLEPGMYFLKVSLKGDIETIKVVKK